MNASQKDDAVYLLHKLKERAIQMLLTEEELFKILKFLAETYTQ